jgi:hypothetical protein
MTTLCCICGKPVQLGSEHPDAVVVHMECLKESMKEVREIVQKRKKRKFSLDGANV